MTWNNKKEWDTTSGEKIYSSDLNRIEDKVEDLHDNKSDNPHDNDQHSETYALDTDLASKADDPHDNTQHSETYALDTDLASKADDPHDNTQHSETYALDSDKADDPHDNSQHSETYALDSDKADDPHDIGGSSHSEDTLSNLNSKISDGNIADKDDVPYLALKEIYTTETSDNLRHDHPDTGTTKSSTFVTILDITITGTLEGFKIEASTGLDNDEDTDETGIDADFELRVNDDVLDTRTYEDLTIGYTRNGSGLTFDGTHDLDGDTHIEVVAKIQNNTDSYAFCDKLEVYYDLIEKTDNQFGDDL